MASERERLDLALVERGLAESRSQAQRLVMAGQVRIDGQLALKPSQSVEPGERLEVDAGPRYVSRGGDKLEAALVGFRVGVEGRVCADVGASTGGFTDCLLQHGAERVYAIDVGRGLLHWRLRHDPRLVLMEGANARLVESLPEPLDLVSVDASFISLRLLLPVAAGWLKAGGDLLALIKPQFEAGRGAVGKGGVVRDPAIHRRVIVEVAEAAAATGLAAQGVLRSASARPERQHRVPSLGTEGRASTDLHQAVERAVDA